MYSANPELSIGSTEEDEELIDEEDVLELEESEETPEEALEEQEANTNTKANGIRAICFFIRESFLLYKTDIINLQSQQFFLFHLFKLYHLSKYVH